MKRYAITVRQPSGHWACRGLAASVQEFLDSCREEIAWLDRFKDVWRVVELPDDPKLPARVVHTP